MPVRRTALAIAAAVMLAASPATADVIARHVPQAQKVGTGTLTVLLWRTYDATLYAPDGVWSPERPFALEIVYDLDISGRKITDSSIDEIRKQGFADETKLAAWRGQLLRIMPDVRDGTRLTGLRGAGGETRFYLGNQEIGVIADPDFTRRFFDIWLSERTSEPKLRRALLGAP